MFAPKSTSDGILSFPLIPPLKQVPHLGSFCFKFKYPSNSTIGLFTEIFISAIVNSWAPTALSGISISGSGSEAPTGDS